MMKTRNLLASAPILLLTPGLAVTVATQDPLEEYDKNPDDGSPWENVLRVNSANGGGSGVYLGGGWMLTAEHVFDDSGPSPASVVFGATTYLSDPAKTFNIANPAPVPGDKTANADLKLFRLTDALPLPTVNLSGPTLGTALTLTGFGGGIKRWGFNNVELADQYAGTSGINDSIVFGSINSAALSEGQAVVFDSGGAAFYFDTTAGEWRLGGIMNLVGRTVGTPETSPPNVTLSVDMEHYAEEIETIIAREGSIPEPGASALLAVAVLLIGKRRRRA